jgi:hypothetical protein
MGLRSALGRFSGIAEGERAVIDKMTLYRIASPKISWQKAGRVVEPGRYMFTFGWLTVTADDIAVWRHHPDARFTMLQIPKSSAPKSPEAPKDAVEDADEYRLGTFELPANSNQT